MKTRVLQIRVEDEIGALVNHASKRTGLSKSEVLRQSIRRGVPEVIRAFDNTPRKTLVEALLDLKGLEIPERKYRFKRRV
jgi:hypothetical protein